MSRKFLVVLLMSLLIAVPAFSSPFLYYASGSGRYIEITPNLLIPEYTFLTYFGAVTEEEPQILVGLRNNAYFLESLRLTRLAVETYEFGDYDASTGFAEEAIRYTNLSDEYVAVHLIAETKRLMDWADSHNIETANPDAYAECKTNHDISMAAFEEGDWHTSIDAATRAIVILTRLESGEQVEIATPRETEPRETDGHAPLPQQYTVRTWANERDCLWNIAGYSWVYGDPWRWRELYNANRSRMPDPNNPDLIEPGFVLEIPSIKGENRQGMWDPNVTYE